MGKWKMSFFVLALVAAMVAFGGCGGGGDGGINYAPETPGGSGNNPPSSGTLQGYFIDGPVEGLTYTTSSNIEGTTDATGKFSYNEGDTIIFKVGNISLPSVSAAGVILPTSYYAGSTNSDARVQKLVQFIASTNATTPAPGANIVVQPDYYPSAHDGKEYSAALFDEIYAADPTLIKLTAAEATAHVTKSQADVQARYAGHYEGTWWHVTGGSYRGSWEIDIDVNGDIDGSYSGGDWGTVSGTLNPSGTTNLSASGNAGPATWQGFVNLASGVMKGTYNAPWYNATGQFEGNKQ